MEKASLFDDVQRSANLTYLSDMHFQASRGRVADAICRLDAEKYGLPDWESLVSYIAKQELCFHEVTEAKAWLLRFLSENK